MGTSEWALILVVTLIVVVIALVVVIGRRRRPDGESSSVDTKRPSRIGRSASALGTSLRRAWGTGLDDRTWEDVEEALLGLEGMDTEVASKLAANGIITRDGLADLAADELTELTGLPAERAHELIMKARAHWFEPAAETAAGA